MKLTSLQNQDPELHDTTYEATGQFMMQHIGAKCGSDMYMLIDPDVEEAWALSEVPAFEVNSSIQYVEARGFSIGWVGFGTFTFSGKKYKCVAEQNASPLILWVSGDTAKEICL